MSLVTRWMAVLALGLGGGVAAPLVPRATLKVTTGGVLVEAVIGNARDGEVLVGVWAAGAKANLMECVPRCRVVSNVPVSGPTALGPRTRYRVVLGGRFRLGQKVGLLFSFRSGIAAVEATVSR